jgi:hypothetical protein
MAGNFVVRQVPCDGCTLCCQGDAVRLEPEDNAVDYQTEPHPYIPGALMLAHKPNGECVYLTKSGCSIHDRAPALCRIADCRSLAVRLDFQTARLLHLMGRLDLQVWYQGHRLLEARRRERARGKSMRSATRVSPPDHPDDNYGQQG